MVNAPTHQDWLRQATQQLAEAHIGTARLDCLVLLEDVLNKDRSWILAHPKTTMSPEAAKTLNRLLGRRLKHEPLAYIRQKTEFYGREFLVNKDVLEPRPESETIVELLKKITMSEQFKERTLYIADIGTGSGALGITAKLENPGTLLTATDIDPACLAVAQHNAQLLGAEVSFLQGDLFQPLLSSQPPVNVLLCNLPYVPTTHPINRAALHEPAHAIFGGEDGLDLYRKLFMQLKPLHARPMYLLTESLPLQHQALSEIAAAHNYKVHTIQDFIIMFELIRA